MHRNQTRKLSISGAHLALYHLKTYHLHYPKKKLPGGRLTLLERTGITGYTYTRKCLRG